MILLPMERIFHNLADMWNTWKERGGKIIIMVVYRTGSELKCNKTYWTPSTVPSFFPDGSSNWTPHQLPGANFVSPIYCKIPARLPIPDETITRSPTAILDSKNSKKKISKFQQRRANVFDDHVQLTGWRFANIAANTMRWTASAWSCWRCSRTYACVHRFIRWTSTGQRFQCQSCQFGENTTFRFALEISFAWNATIIFAACIVQYDAGPIAWCKMCFANECYLTGPMAANPNVLTDYEFIGIGGEGDTMI